MFGVSVLTFKEKWQRSFVARPRITILCAVGLLVIGLGFAGMN